MTLLVVIWSMLAGVTFSLGAVHLVVWLKNHQQYSSLAVTCAAWSVSCVTLLELRLLHSKTPEAYGQILKLAHVPVFFVVIGLVVFVHCQLGGRIWIAAIGISLRLISLIANMLAPVNVNYRKIVELGELDFLGATVSIVSEGVLNPWLKTAELSTLFILVYVINTGIRAHRSSSPEIRRKAWSICGSITFFIFCGGILGILIHRDLLHMPYPFSLAFTAIVLAMGYELSQDILRAAQLTKKLEESLADLTDTAEAGKVALWSWNISEDIISVNPFGKTLYGFESHEEIGFQDFAQTVHPDDRTAALQAVENTLKHQQPFQKSYRIIRSDGTMKWIEAQGHSTEWDRKGNVTKLKGISVDVSKRKVAEMEARTHRDILAHRERVSMLGELSASLAHELRQPLAIILSNAQVGLRLLQQDEPDTQELLEILQQITSADQRASLVIQQMREMLTRGESSFEVLDLKILIDEVISLLGPDLAQRKVRCTFNCESRIRIHGDRIQLQQVIMNLLLNACDAMDSLPASDRVITVNALKNEKNLCISITDRGEGFSGDPEQIFQPFYTTKEKGLGIGLSLCRSITLAHKGRLWATNGETCGAVLLLELPCLEENTTT